MKQQYVAAKPTGMQRLSLQIPFFRVNSAEYLHNIHALYMEHRAIRADINTLNVLVSH